MDATPAFQSRQAFGAEKEKFNAHFRAESYVARPLLKVSVGGFVTRGAEHRRYHRKYTMDAADSVAERIRCAAVAWLRTRSLTSLQPPGKKSYTGAGWATHVKTHPGTSNPKLVELRRKIKIQKAPGSQS